MDKLLIVGIDTIIGGNLAAWLAPRYQIVGLSLQGPLSIAGCETAVCDPGAIDAPRQWVASERPQKIVYCGPGARSTFDLAPAMALRSEAVSVAGAWARAAKEFGCDLTLISSDAVFTGPWMFHREGSQCNCESPAAKILQLIEAEVAEGCPNALIVRTNAYGWSPLADEAGLVERVLQAAQEGEPLSLDCMRHATPILATDLADLLERAWFCRLEGLYHVAGGERVNPFRFACLLADQFHLPMSSFDAIETSLERRREFGAGETSLQSRKVRKALDVALPLVRDGLSRLYEQYVSGYRDRFGALEPVLAEKVA